MPAIYSLVLASRLILNEWPQMSVLVPRFEMRWRHECIRERTMCSITAHQCSTEHFVLYVADNDLWWV
jgi:hypothetical protein